MFGTALEIKKTLNAELSGNGDISFEGISTDSRTFKDGEIFLALKGKNFDGHGFINELLGRAKGFIVEKGTAIKGGKDFFVIYVNNTLDAYATLANYWRKKINPKVISVTGSLGKTTTKELIAAVLAKKFKVLKTHANLNNIIGLSRTLLSLKDEEIAVLELGINNVGEMESLCQIALPDIGIVTNIAPVHLEGLESLSKIYMEKKVILDYSKEAVFINKEDSFLKNYQKKGIKKIFFGKGSPISYSKTEFQDFKSMSLSVYVNEEKLNVIFPYINLGLPILISLAAGVGKYFGVRNQDIIDAIAAVKLPRLRMEILEFKNKKIILDAYNANPVSVKYAIKSLLKLEGKKKSVIIGDIKELGKYSRYYHVLLGRFLAKIPLRHIVLVGEEIYNTHLYLKNLGIKSHHFKNVEEARKIFEKILKDSDILLIKGSRAVELEKILGETVYVV